MIVPDAVDVAEHEVPAEPAVARSGRSRLTTLPGVERPSVVTRSVSGETSRRKHDGVARRHGQAHAVDGDAVARRQLGGRAASATLEDAGPPALGPIASTRPSLQSIP